MPGYYLALNEIDPYRREWSTRWIGYEPMEASMHWYLLFGGWNDTLGGAADFHSLHTSEKEARETGLKKWGTEDSVRMAAWMQLTVFRPDAKRPLVVIANLHIPGAENCSTGGHVEEDMWEVLHWVDEGPEDPVYSAEG